MARRLLACPGCARHVRVEEARCPFCGFELPASFPSTPGRLPPPPGLTRDELFRYGFTAATVSAGALATAVALGSCGEPTAQSYGFACCSTDPDASGEFDAGFRDSGRGPPNLLDTGASPDAALGEAGDARLEAEPDARDASGDESDAAVDARPDGVNAE